VLFITRGPQRRSGQLLLEQAHAGQVVRVAVGEQDGLRLETVLMDRGRQGLGLRRETGIYEPAVGLALRPEQRPFSWNMGSTKVSMLSGPCWVMAGF